MSKAKLKKELTGYSQEQLVNLILEAYDARKEIKDYFDYFLNPDVERVTERYTKRAAKELTRVKWSHLKTRITVIKKLVREYGGYGIEPETYIEFPMSIAVSLMKLDRAYYLSDGQQRLIATLISDAMIYAADRGVYDKWLSLYTKGIDDAKPDSQITGLIADAIAKASATSGRAQARRSQAAK